MTSPTFGQYGTWEAANPECVAQGLSTSDDTKMIQLLFACICGCQVIFMASRAPRVTWEAVYLPLVETCLYGMASSGNGSIRLADGRMVPIARFCSWIITCPIMLFQVVGIHEVKIKGISCKNMVMAACLIRTIFGIGASVTISPPMRWIQYVLSCFTFFFELWCVYNIYDAGLKKFGAVSTPLNNIIRSRIMLLRFLFYLSWSAFPIVWLLSSTGLCMISEDHSVLSYLVCDVICKNIYGITNANTLFRVLDGKWEPDTLEDGPSSPEHKNDKATDSTYLGQLISRASKRSSPPGAVDPANPLAHTFSMRSDQGQAPLGALGQPPVILPAPHGSIHHQTLAALGLGPHHPIVNPPQSELVPAQGRRSADPVYSGDEKGLYRDDGNGPVMYFKHGQDSSKDVQAAALREEMMALWQTMREDLVRMWHSMPAQQPSASAMPAGASQLDEMLQRRLSQSMPVPNDVVDRLPSHTVDAPARS